MMVGISLNGILMLTMSLSCSLAAIAGAGLLFMYPSYSAVGLEPLYMAWFVVILAGLGNVLGAVMCSFMVALTNFVLSCAIGGILGGFYAHYYGILTPDIMHTSETVEVLAVAFIGGRGSLWGGAAIAFPFIFAMELIRSSLSELPGINLVLYGILLILVMIYYPGGFAEFFNTHIRETKSKMIGYIFNGVSTAV